MTIHATLRYDDADGAIAFLTGGLGLVERDIYAAVHTADAHVIKSVIHDWDDEPPPTGFPVLTAVLG